MITSKQINDRIHLCHNQHFYKQYQAEIEKKVKQRLSKIPEAKLLTKMSKKLCLFQLDFMVNSEENEKDNKKGLYKYNTN